VRICIIPLLAVSILNQANLIKRLAEEQGHEVAVRNYVGIPELTSHFADAYLWFTVAAGYFLSDHITSYLMCRDRKAWYVTIEGIPSKDYIRHSNIPRAEFIANSRFTATCLARAGLKIIDVVYHAIDLGEVKRAIELGKAIRRKLDQEAGDRVKLLFVGRVDPRKGLDRLAQAVEILNQKRPNDFVLYMITENATDENLQKLLAQPNVKMAFEFGSRSHTYVLAWMHACDYLIFPSKCEGFGLPVLEANAVGRPVVHVWMPPLDEFSSKEFNFVFPYADQVYAKIKAGQYWILHEYEPDWLADMIEYAIDVYKNSRSEYEEYCMKAMEHAAQFDYHNIYPKLLKHLLPREEM